MRCVYTVRFLLVIILSFSLSSCFIVHNFGKYWNEGTLDSKLEGSWRDIMSGKLVTVIRRGDAYGYAELKDPTRLKTLSVGENITYLMLQGPQGGALFRYAATEDRLVIYTPDPAAKDSWMRFIQNSKNFIQSEKGVSIISLDDTTVKLLQIVGVEQVLWEEKMIFERYKPLSDATIDAEKKLDDVPDPFAEIREKYKELDGKKIEDIDFSDEINEEIEKIDANKPKNSSIESLEPNMKDKE